MNKGKCGICGDPYNSPQPRENEAGGKYGKGIISRSYKANSIIKVRVELSTNHKGWFEFRLCPNNNIRLDPGQVIAFVFFSFLRLLSLSLLLISF